MKVVVGLSGGPPSLKLRRGKSGLRIAVGLSGGVDSAVAAALLKEQGYDVSGVFLECWNEPGCRTDEDRKDALKVALKLKIPFKVLDFRREYKRKVMDWFYRELKKGRTPNPDVVCNQEIKFGLFLKWAVKNKFDYVATGHYAQLVVDSSTINFRAHASRRLSGHDCARKFTLTASTHLLQSVDKKKDQTYFLAMLNQKQLSRVLFPVGGMTKKQVRQEARKRGLAVWDKKDSTGICFINHDLSFEEFVKRKVKEHQGEVVNLEGEEIGKHKGVEFYTIGQRHGFKIIDKSIRRPKYYVINKDLEKNRLVVGLKRDLARKEFEVEKWSWISRHKGLQGETLKVRIRHQGRLINCKIVGKKVKLREAVEGVASGQVAVIYGQTECFGGGVIN